MPSRWHALIKCVNSTPRLQKPRPALIFCVSRALENATRPPLCRCGVCVFLMLSPTQKTVTDAQLLLESQQWAAELNLSSLTCPWTIAPSSADLRIVGFDQQHRPVIYSSMLMVVPCNFAFAANRLTRIHSATPPCVARTKPSSTHLASWRRLRHARATAARQTALG